MSDDREAWVPAHGRPPELLAELLGSHAAPANSWEWDQAVRAAIEVIKADPAAMKTAIDLATAWPGSVADTIAMMGAVAVTAAGTGAQSVVEHAIEMSGGSMQIRNDDPAIDRIFPLDQWIKSHQRFGGHVWRRTVRVVEDWSEVPRAAEPTQDIPADAAFEGGDGR